MTSLSAYVIWLSLVFSKNVSFTPLKAKLEERAEISNSVPGIPHGWEACDWLCLAAGMAYSNHLAVLPVQYPRDQVIATSHSKWCHLRCISHMDLCLFHLACSFLLICVPVLVSETHCVITVAWKHILFLAECKPCLPILITPNLMVILLQLLEVL